VTVRCEPTVDGWRCRVRVGDDAGATEHEVAVPAAELARLAPGSADPEALVAASFGYLLDREPREAILRRFEIGLIERYFPGWSTAMARRFGAR
jgi:hypothetical protein